MLHNLWLILFLSAILGGVTCETCDVSDLSCDDEKRASYHAIAVLHGQLDDDKNGNVDLQESTEFLTEELQYPEDSQRHSKFHQEDPSVSVNELWNTWTSSEVYNWTIADVVAWLETHVELPEYVDVFKIHDINGSKLPRLAANVHYLTTTLGIRNPVHRQKISLKAADLVLFGAPKKPHSYLYDVWLTVSVMLIGLAVWFAYLQRQKAHAHINKMVHDFENLQKAECALEKLQSELDEYRKKHEHLAKEKKSVEEQLREEIAATELQAGWLREERQGTNEEITRLRLAEQELIQVRALLKHYEERLQQERRHASIPEALRLFLQLTHEIEIRYYNAKRHIADQQLASAKESCEKIRKKRSTLIGSFRFAHESGIDDVDQRIIDARSSIEELRIELQERINRWKQIEKLCRCDIVYNPGLPTLQKELVNRGLLQLPLPSFFNIGREVQTENSLENAAAKAALVVSTSMHGLNLAHNLDVSTTNRALTASSSMMQFPDDISISPSMAAGVFIEAETLQHCDSMPSLAQEDYHFESNRPTNFSSSVSHCNESPSPPRSELGCRSVTSERESPFVSREFVPHASRQLSSQTPEVSQKTNHSRPADSSHLHVSSPVSDTPPSISTSKHRDVLLASHTSLGAESSSSASASSTAGGQNHPLNRATSTGNSSDGNLQSLLSKQQTPLLTKKKDTPQSSSLEDEDEEEKDVKAKAGEKRSKNKRNKPMFFLAAKKK